MTDTTHIRTHRDINKSNTQSAFPTWSEAGDHISDGMTLRDYFAGQTLPGLHTSRVDPDTAANIAYGIADAMMKRRSKK